MNIRREIEIFLKRTGMRPTRVGRLAARDPRLVFDIRMGRELRPGLTLRVRRFIESHEA
jgi:hypothetical protein